MVLDLAMPRWTSRERHSIAIPPASANVMSTVEHLTWKRVPTFHRIITLGGMGTRDFFGQDEPVLDFLLNGPYRIIHRSETELVIGGILPLNKTQRLPELGPQPVDAFRELNSPGIVKVAANFLVRDGMLSTQTRNLPIGLPAQVLFGGYWVGIRAGSGVIRRSWLRGIRDELVSAQLEQRSEA